MVVPGAATEHAMPAICYERPSFPSIAMTQNETKHPLSIKQIIHTDHPISTRICREMLDLEYICASLRVIRDEFSVGFGFEGVDMLVY
jgi:hypothetical protein